MTKKSTAKPTKGRPRGRPRKTKVKPAEQCCNKADCCLSKLCVCSFFKGVFNLLKRLVGR